MKPLVIHAGFHKTGTSSIQAFFRSNRKALAPHVAVVLKGDMEDLIRACRGYSKGRSGFDRAKVTLRAEALFAKLATRPKKALLLSAEELSGHMPGRPGTDDYGAAVDILGDLVRVAKTLMPKRAVTICLGTRQPDAWIESAYWEHVKSSSLTSGLEDFRAAFRPVSDLDGMVNKILTGAMPDRILRMPLEKAPEDGLAAPILDLLDLPFGLRETLKPVAEKNRRDPPQMREEFLRINREVTDRAERARMKKALRRGEVPIDAETKPD